MNEINKLFEERYDFLISVAKNLLFKYFYEEYKKGDVVAELYLYMISNEEKLSKYIEKGTLEGFAVTWLSTQIRYANSPFNTKNKTSYNDFNIDYYIESDELIVEDPYIEDLKSIYTDLQIENILKVKEVYKMLEPQEKVLFDLYFNKEMTDRKIAVSCGIKMSHTSTYYMIKNLVKKIKSLL